MKSSQYRGVMFYRRTGCWESLIWPLGITFIWVILLISSYIYHLIRLFCHLFPCIFLSILMWLILVSYLHRLFVLLRIDERLIHCRYLPYVSQLLPIRCFNFMLMHVLSFVIPSMGESDYFVSYNCIYMAKAAASI